MLSFVHEANSRIAVNSKEGIESKMTSMVRAEAIDQQFIDCCAFIGFVLLCHVGPD